MYTAIKGTYENGQVVLEEAPPTQRKTKVLVIFLVDEEKSPKTLRKGVELGSENQQEKSDISEFDQFGSVYDGHFNRDACYDRSDLR